jgi:hypothetical protein
MLMYLFMSLFNRGHNSSRGEELSRRRFPAQSRWWGGGGRGWLGRHASDDGGGMRGGTPKRGGAWRRRRRRCGWAPTGGARTPACPGTAAVQSFPPQAEMADLPGFRSELGAKAWTSYKKKSPETHVLVTHWKSFIWHSKWKHPFLLQMETMQNWNQ